MATKSSVKKKARVAASAKDISRVSFRYVFRDDYNPMYANGAHGGVTTQGEIALNFYVERQPLPHVEIHNISPDGKLSALVEREPPQPGEHGALNVIRYITTGVLMNKEVARRVYDFIGRQLAHLEGTVAQSETIEAEPEK